MKDVTTYCEKTIEFTNESIRNTEATLRNLTENQEFLNIGKVLKTNVEPTKRQLQQWKFKKFNNLKYKPQPIIEQTPAITQANFKKSYANAVKGNTNIIDPKVQHFRKTSKKKKHPRKTTNCLEKSGITTSGSYTTPPWEIAYKSPFYYKTTSTNREEENKDLRNKTKLLKQNQKERDTQEHPKHTENKEEYSQPKSIQMASASGGHTQTNIDLLKVLKECKHFQTTANNYKRT